MSPSHDELVTLIDDEAATVTRLLAGADLSRPVPSCPEWSARDLVEHLGSVHRWATEVVRTGQYVDGDGPAYDDGGLAPWFAAGAAGLTATLASTDPSRPCWTLGPPRDVGFWSRRQLHETMLHRWDLEQALGQDSRLDSRLAADGVDEGVMMLFPRQVRLGRVAPLADALEFVDTATDRRWLITGDGSSDSTTGDPGRTPDATVTGDPADLLLLLWHRATVDQVDATVTGDVGVARRVLAAPLTP